MIRSILLVSGLFFISMQSNQAQVSIDTIFGCDNFPSNNAEILACSICNFDILYGSTFPYTPGPDAGWCGTIENDQYIGFVASTSTSVVFSIDAFNCTLEQGVQVGIYDRYNNLVGDCFNQVFPGLQEVFSAGNLTPGEVYFIRIDGFAGDGCEFNIQVISGIAPAPPPPIDTIFGPTTTCLDVDNTFFTTIGSSSTNSSYRYEFFAGPEIGDIVLRDTSYIGTNGGIEAWVSVTFDGATSSLSPGECDTVGIEVTPVNFCTTTDTSTYLNINVCRPLATPDTIYQNESYPFCRSAYLDSITGRTYTEGIYILPNTNSSGITDCDKVVKLTVTSLGTRLSADITGSRFYCQNDGTLTVNVSGGVAPYTYEWIFGGNTLSTDSILPGINQPGRYFVEITDAVGCSVRRISANIESFDEELSDISFNIYPTDCNGQGGRISILANYPSIFDVTWSNGSTDTAVVDNLVSGNYSLTLIEPTNGCRFDTVLNVPIADTCFGIISGNVQIANTVDCLNPGGLPLPNALVNCSNGESVFTDRSGAYRFVVDTGTYDITIVRGPRSNIQSVCDQTITIDIPAIPSQFPDNNFYFESDSLLDISLTKTNTPPNRGRTNYVALTTTNNGFITSNFTVTFNVPINQIFISSTFPGQYDAQTRIFSYEVQDLDPGQTHVNRINLRSLISAMLGDTVHYTATIDSTTTANDFYTVDNSVVCLDTIIAAYDPNDKAVIPRGDEVEGFLPNSDTVLQYTIRFENTGSADALYVRLEDQLSPNLDPSTFKPISGSAEYLAYFNDSNRLFIEFNDIVLRPLAVDSLNAQGFFSYSIRPYPNLAPGTQILNTAAIYFDFNDPIITNTVVNTIALPSSTRRVSDQPSFLIYPNPNSGDLTVHLQEEQQVESMHLISIDGRLLPALDFQGAGKTYKLNLKNSGIAEGIYTLRLTLASGEVMHQLFVLKQ